MRDTNLSRFVKRTLLEGRRSSVAKLQPEDLVAEARQPAETLAQPRAKDRVTLHPIRGQAGASQDVCLQSFGDGVDNPAISFTGRRLIPREQ